MAIGIHSPCAPIIAQTATRFSASKSMMFVWMFALLLFALKADRRNAGSAQFMAASWTADSEKSVERKICGLLSLVSLTSMTVYVIRSALMNTFSL